MHLITGANHKINGERYKVTINAINKKDTDNRVTGTITTEINKIDSMDFIMFPTNEAYEDLKPYRTRLLCTNSVDDNIEFVGRVLKATPSLSSAGEICKNVTCENYMGFLTDTSVPLKVYKGKVKDVINDLFQEHNLNSQDFFYLESCDIDKEIEISPEGESVFDCIMNRVISEVGGEFELIKCQPILDKGETIEFYYKFTLALKNNAEYIVSTNEINIGDNLISYSADEDGSNLCTRIIPYGAKIYTDEDNLERIDITSVNSGKNYLEVDSVYGKITRTIIFSDIEDPDELKNEGQKYLEKYSNISKTYSITAFDKHWIDKEIPKFDLRKWYYVNAPILGINRLLLRITKKTICIENPANDTFTVGDSVDLTASSASASTPTSADVNKIYDAIGNYEKINAHQINAIYANIHSIEADNVNINNLSVMVAQIDSLTASDAIIKNIKTQVLSADEIKAAVAEVGYITADMAELRFADINLGNIEAGSITQAMLGDEVVGTAQIEDGSITSAKIVELNANKITAGTLSVERLIISGSEQSVLYALNNSGELSSTSVDSLDGALLSDRSITADKIVANAITSNEIATNTITANNILAGAITADKIASGAITTVKIASNAITAAKIASGVITTEKLASGAVTADKINVTDLFSKNITATGSISGVTIKGSSGEFTKRFSVKVPIFGSSAPYMRISSNSSGIDLGICDEYDEYDGYAHISLTDEGTVWINAYNYISVYSRGDMYIEAANGGISLQSTNNISMSAITVTGGITSKGNIALDNANTIYGRNKGGTARAMLQYSSGNNTVIGYGGYSASEGATNIYGNSVSILAKGNVAFGSAATNANFSPNISGKHRLGSSTYKWQYLYATNGTIQTSDVRYKDDIQTLSYRYQRFFDLLKAVSFRWKNIDANDNHDRTRLGFIAQDVKEAMDVAGLSELDFAGWCADPVYPSYKDGDGNLIEDRNSPPIDYIQGLNYEEFIPLVVDQTQKLKKDVKELYQEVILPLISVVQYLKSEVEMLKN